MIAARPARPVSENPIVERVQSHTLPAGRDASSASRLEHVQELRPQGAAMSVVVTYLAYLLVSIGLTLAVGRALARNGRLFLLDVFGNDGPAEAISNLLVVAFYLINLGFVALTM